MGGRSLSQLPSGERQGTPGQVVSPLQGQHSDNQNKQPNMLTGQFKIEADMHVFAALLDYILSCKESSPDVIIGQGFITITRHQNQTENITAANVTACLQN